MRLANKILGDWKRKTRIALTAFLVAFIVFLSLPSIEIKINDNSYVSIGVSYVRAASWANPTSHTANGWADPTYAYDDETTLYASYTCSGGAWTPYLELYISSISCSKVQAYCTYQNGQVNGQEVDVYYSGSWHNIYSSTPQVGAYYEYAIGSTEDVTGMRFRFQASGGQSRYAGVNDADFWDESAGADISNTPSSIDFGTVSESSTNWSNGSEPSWPLTDGDAYFTVTNNGGGTIDIDFKATNFSGGNGWTLTTGSPSSDTVRMSVFVEGGGSGSGVALTTSDQTIITSLASSADIDWELKLETGTYTDGVAKQSTITLTAIP